MQYLDLNRRAARTWKQCTSTFCTVKRGWIEIWIWVLKKFNHSSSVFIPWAHNFFRKTYLANKLSYISRRVRWSSALHDRTLVGQTGNIPPISSVQPQQCHLVGFPHITQLRTDLNGSSMGPSWCFDSGRMGFALSSIVTFDHNSFMKKSTKRLCFFAWGWSAF